MNFPVFVVLGAEATLLLLLVPLLLCSGSPNYFHIIVALAGGGRISQTGWQGLEV